MGMHNMELHKDAQGVAFSGRLIISYESHLDDLDGEVDPLRDGTDHQRVQHRQEERSVPRVHPNLLRGSGRMRMHKEMCMWRCTRMH